MEPDCVPAVYLVGIVDDRSHEKSSIAEVLAGYFQRQKKVTIIPFEAFRKPDVACPFACEARAYDFDMLFDCLSALKAAKSYTFPDGKILEHSEVMIIEGLHAFFDPRTRPLYDAKVFVDVDNDVRLSSIIKRATKEGENIEETLANYHRYIKPVYDGEMKSQRAYADTVLVGGLSNMNAVRLLVDRIAQVLMLSLSRSNSPKHNERKTEEAGEDAGQGKQ